MSNEKKTIKKEAVIIAAILLLSLFLRFYPAVTNEFPKGSDSYFHIRVAEEIEKNGSLFINDPLTGTVNNYPPLFHVMLSVLFRLSDPFTVARFIGPVLGFISMVVLFFFVSSMFGRRAAIGSTFVYGIAVEIINKAVFTIPEGIGFLLIFLTLYEFNKYLKGKKKVHSYIAVVTATLTALTHPLSFIMLVVFLFAFFTDLKKIIFVLIIPALASVVWILYTNSLGAMTSIIPTSISLNYVFFGFSPVFFALGLGCMDTIDSRKKYNTGSFPGIG
ncbi:glycosyltransferase family 39 protein [archaeon]|nr:glycosyltransferase family 39 protein [archaeon]